LGPFAVLGPWPPALPGLPMASYATDSSPLQLYWQKEATRERSKLQVWRSRVNTEISMIDEVSLLVKKQHMTNASEKKKKKKE